MNAAADKESALQTELQAQKERHEVNILNLKERLKEAVVWEEQLTKENVELTAWVAKGES